MTARGVVARTGVVVALALTLSLPESPFAHAWSNGGDGYKNFGTHDWILREAIHVLGDDASWVRPYRPSRDGRPRQPGRDRTCVRHVVARLG